MGFKFQFIGTEIIKFMVLMHWLSTYQPLMSIILCCRRTLLIKVSHQTILGEVGNPIWWCVCIFFFWWEWHVPWPWCFGSEYADCVSWRIIFDCQNFELNLTKSTDFGAHWNQGYFRGKEEEEEDVRFSNTLQLISLRIPPSLSLSHIFLTRK